MAESKRKRAFICISSSSEEEVEDSEDDEEEEDDEDDDDADDDDDDDNDDYDHDDEDVNDDDDDDYNEEEDDDDCGGDDESLCNKVIRLLKDGGDLESLTLKDCKSYLRKHGLRLAGAKAVCIQRIEEHWRIKDGNGEAFYPRSTFVINCTGDVCKGDVVLFTQKVYERFNKVTRHGRPQGKRTVSGRVVKESYGAAKQQHTFTVEVLWSKGSNRLPPLSPLLVKGRNLYRLRTFRQRWSNDSERIKVLAEKHKRGTAARLVKAMKNTKKTRSTSGGVKRQKQFHHTRPSQSRKTFAPEKGKHFDRHGKAAFQGHANFRNHNQRQETPPLRQVNIKGNANSGASKPSRRRQKFAHHNDDRVPTFQSYVDPSQIHQSQIKYQNGSLPYHLSWYDMGFTLNMMRLSPPFRDSSGTSASQHQGLKNSKMPIQPHHVQLFSGIPESINVDRLLHPFPSGAETYGQWNYRF